MEQMTARSGLQTGQWPWTKGPSTRLAMQRAIAPAIALKVLFPPSPLTASAPYLLNPNLVSTGGYYPLSPSALGYSPLHALEGDAKWFSV
jgi:hypothetical protein